MNTPLSSDEIALRYLEQLPWPPYPFQEQAILSWFEPGDGILVCAPTGTGKTAIAEAALYEALVTGRRAYYTTPLIALTEQKFQELQAAAVRWGYQAEDVGLVTGNRRVNADAPILVVVAEILLNRLLAPDEFAFDDVSAVVMDEFHSFNDPERGIVWELSLGMLPRVTRTLLISATVGNATDFVVWLNRHHSRRLRLLQSTDRRVPLDFRWVPDELLADQIELLCQGDEDTRYSPALVFCFNRNECWTVAEQLKGKRLLADGQQKQLQLELDALDWSIGAGGKLKQILIRGVGVHHAGLLPRYRRAIESLFQKKLLSVCVCTETLAAGINLPARSVVMVSLLKGPPGRMKVIDSSSAHQMFGRAGRPQFDSRGYIFAVAHEDDVKMFRWQEKYDAIPDDSKDPMIRRAKKNLRKKMPRRKDGEQYWTEKQFQTLRESPPAKLASHGRLPWRLLAFLIRKSGTVQALEDAIHRRLLDHEQKEDAQRQMRRMLLTLEAAGFVTLDPAPPSSLMFGQSMAFRSCMATLSAIELLPTDGTEYSAHHSRWTSTMVPGSEGLGEVHDFSHTALDDDEAEDFGVGVLDTDDQERTAECSDQPGDTTGDNTGADPVHGDSDARDIDFEPDVDEGTGNAGSGLLGALIREARDSGGVASTSVHQQAKQPDRGDPSAASAEADLRLSEYQPRLAIATPQLDLLFAFRSVNAIYAVFLAEHFHRASYEERLQLMESVLAIPRSAAGSVRVPFPERMPPGPLVTGYLNPLVLSRGLATQDELTGYRDEETGRRIPPLALGDKMRMLFRSEFPGVTDFDVTSVWCVGELLRFGGDFNKFVRAKEATKQEGILFRHCLRMILLCGEFAQIEPPELDPQEWRNDLSELAFLLTESCRKVDPASTDDILRSLPTGSTASDTLL